MIRTGTTSELVSGYTVMYCASAPNGMVDGYRIMLL